jgi:hypothetical protein
MTARETPGCDESARYLMLYCDNIRCRVNTFEHGSNGRCPGCNRVGEEVGNV